MRRRRPTPDARRAATAVASRRGVTLIEMLVTLAVLLVMMTLVVRIFQAATGSLNAAQAFQEIDGQFRRLDGVLRSDLAGVTAKMTPPNDPQNHSGYFELAENEFPDAQGEDGDDTLRFTAKAPAGRPFTGRIWAPPKNAALMNAANTYATFQSGFQPITVTSEYAEIVYFLRNGNLYRRVLLVAPERQSSIVPTINNMATITTSVGATTMGTAPSSFIPSTLGSQVSWQAVHDLSAHPAPRGLPFSNNSVILNTLGDLTNRENRWPNQRFADDFVDLNGNPVPDGLADDRNGDNVPDYYPTLYPTVLSPVNNPSLINVSFVGPGQWTHIAAMAFPFVYPGSYSRPQALTTTAVHPGWIHSPEPLAGSGFYQYDSDPLNYLNSINHAPIDSGDNLPIPQSGTLTAGGGYQTWWGFPTWRETLSPAWNDPTYPVHGVPPLSLGVGQPVGLNYQDANVTSVADDGHLLPAMNATYRNLPQPFNDGFGAATGLFPSANTAYMNLWNGGWEDDLIMTGVRSFDIKVYDPSLGTYADLGWGDDPRLTSTLIPAGSVGLGSGLNLPFLQGNYDLFTGAFGSPAYGNVNGTFFDVLNQTFAHEGRMPPLVSDFRFDAQFGAVAAGYYAGYPNYTGNVGDDNLHIFRLRRVWDSWSTAYTKAPGTGVNPTGSPAPGFPAGPPFAPPIYPSYPAPYPAPLRGIQIQVRVTDPTSQRIKILTIRQDFTDKL